MDFNAAHTAFTETLRKAAHIRSAVALLHWDMQTIMPKKGAESRAQALGFLQGEAFRLQTAPAFGSAIEALRGQEERLAPTEKRMLELAAYEYGRFSRIPADVYEAFSVATAQASHRWMQAKEDNDFAAFKPHLQKMIDYSRQFAEWWGYADKPYDAMLEAYDPELLTAQIDPIFAALLEGTRRLLAKVGAPAALPAVQVPAENQKAVGEYLLRVMGYDMDAGNLFTTEHPFTVGIHAGDVRVTTKYHTDMPQSSIFSVLHEGGHGMYMQNIAKELEGTNLSDGASMGIHESQSRTWENIVGRSRAFWQTHFDEVCRLCGVRLAADAAAFYRGINAVRPSLIRIEADELTYNLHIIIRYECEKAIFNNGVNADDLPELWREKYREYLGVVPETYSTGVLQDSHWSGGSFGYFPSYAIGNLCAAQFAAAYEKQNGPLATALGTPAGLAKLAAWQRENIHRYGALEKPAQLMRRVCGGDVDPAYFLRYMEEKLEDVYPDFGE